MEGTDLHAVESPETQDTAAAMAAYATRDGIRTRAGAALVKRAETHTENTARKRAWLKKHPRDVIREAESHKFGTWHECLRDGRPLYDADDLGMLMNRLEEGFDTPESRQP